MREEPRQTPQAEQAEPDTADPGGLGRTLLAALGATAVTLVLAGLCYPLLMTGLSLVLFPQQAHGSLVRDDRGQVVGSELIGQPFAQPAYFHGRVSAAGAGYDALASGGSNLGVTSRKLRERVVADLERLRKENPE